MAFEKLFMPGPWFAVNYAGYWNIQATDKYEETELFNEETYANASYNAQLAAKAPDLFKCLEELNLALDEYWNGEKNDDQVKKICNLQRKAYIVMSLAISSNT